MSAGYWLPAWRYAEDWLTCKDRPIRLSRMQRVALKQKLKKQQQGGEHERSIGDRSARG